MMSSGRDRDTAPSGRELTALAVSATLHCLTGCAIGEVLGMVLGTWWGWGDWSTIALAVLAVPGAMDAGLTNALFWGSLAFALVVAFVVTVPVNRALIRRGKGHAVVHELHH